MYYTATINAYDALGKILVGVVIREKPSPGEDAPAKAETLQIEVDGTGETDPRQWLRDVLVAALERV